MVTRVQLLIKYLSINEFCSRKPPDPPVLSLVTETERNGPGGGGVQGKTRRWGEKEICMFVRLEQCRLPKCFPNVTLLGFKGLSDLSCFLCVPRMFYVTLLNVFPVLLQDFICRIFITNAFRMSCLVWEHCVKSALIKLHTLQQIISQHGQNITVLLLGQCPFKSNVFVKRKIYSYRLK